MANPYGKYRLHLKNFRAIEEADITLDGITVVAGINACGKSTISRLFYKTFWSAINFESIVFESVLKKYDKIANGLEELSQELNPGGYFIDYYSSDYDKDFNKNEEGGYHQVSLGQLQGNLQRLHKLFAAELALSEKTRNMVLRFLRTGQIYGVISEQGEITNHKECLLNALTELEANVKKDIATAKKELAARDIRRFNGEMWKDFSELYDEDGSVFSFFDDDGVITDIENGYFAPIWGIKRAYYYDTPYLNLQMPAYGRERGGGSDNLRETLKSSKRENWNANANVTALNAIFQRLLQGKISAQLILTDYEDATYETVFEYLRDDGLKIDFHECSSGFKVLGLLQMLMNKGALTETTAVFLDEPEAYLHPEWIVEYARMLVLINKTLGTRFFVATHNPDMTSAIRYISEKEGTLDSVNFYIAEESPTSKYQFRYKEAKEDDKNIEPLFKSFARALDKISEYSIGEEDDE